MVNQISKLSSYIGFAKKSRSICIGADKILSLRRNSVILVSSDLSQNTYNKLNNHSLKTGSVIFRLNPEQYLEIVGNPVIKAISITDENLNKAIIACINK